MAAGDLVQVGQAWKVGFGDMEYDGYMPTDWTIVDGEADDETIPDTRGATITHILSNPRKTMNGTLLIKDTGDITPPKTGSYIWIQGPADAAAEYHYVVSASVAFTSGVSRLTLSLLIEDAQSNGAVWVSSSTQQATGQDYDLAAPGDLTDDITLNDATGITKVVDGDGTVLAATTDYTFAGGTFTLVNAGWLSTTLTPVGTVATVWVYLDVGAPLTIVITCIDTTP